MNLTFGTYIRRVLLLTMCVISLNGCYYMQAARGQLDVLNKREPIDARYSTSSS